MLEGSVVTDTPHKTSAVEAPALTNQIIPTPLAISHGQTENIEGEAQAKPVGT
jgi:hypothetical protein